MDTSQPSEPESSPPPTGAAGGGPGAPYQNLFVPLVVVPFLVVGVLVLVFLFFGAIRGEDASLEQNLETLVQGGTNERKQAAMNLSVQVAENRKARDQGREQPWPSGPDFLDRLQGSWEALAEEDNQHLRMALAVALLELGDPGARTKMEEFLSLSDESDPDGELRFIALGELGNLGDSAAAPAVIPFLSHADPPLRLGAAAALQAMPGAASVSALKGVLGDPSLELRGMAAISLSHLGDASGAEVLAELTSSATYEAVRAEDPRKYADPELVQNSRIYAVQALARLERAEDRGLLEELAEGDSDPEVREAAMLALRAP